MVEAVSAIHMEWSMKTILKLMVFNTAAFCTVNAASFYSLRFAELQGKWELVTIDTVTDNVTKIADISGSHTLVRGSDFAIENTPDNKLLLKHMTESGTAFNYINTLDGSVSLAFNSVGVTSGPGLSYNSNGRLYVYNEASGMTSGNLSEVSDVTGVVSNIGSSGTPSILGIEFDSSGNLWASDEFTQRMYRIDPTSGAVIWTGSVTSEANLLDIDAKPNGDLYVISLKNIYSVDKSTGNITSVFQENSSDFFFRGLANTPIIVPEPATLLGCSLALLAAYLLRPKKRAT
jgi:hypothetical protein